MIDLDDYSIRLELLEYNKIEGMITQADYTKSIRKGKFGKGIKKVQKMNQNEIYTVLRVDNVGGYIDLSKVEISPEDAKIMENKFAKGKSVQSLMISICEKFKIGLQELYSSIVFPLQKSGEHAYDVLHNNIFHLEKLITPLKLDPKLETALIEVIKNKYTPPPEKIKAVFELRTLSKNGVLDLKDVLTKAEAFSTPEITLQVMLEATPFYTVQTITPNRQKAVEVIEECLKFIQLEIEKLASGKFELKTFNKLTNENENEYASLVQMNAMDDKRSILEEDNDEDMGVAEEFTF